MTSVAAFTKSLSGDVPPAGLDPPLVGLWRAARGEWDAAHVAVQDEATPDAAWVHAHLHRIGGDLENARYWYGMAGRPESAAPLEEERDAILRALLAGKGKG